jgi:uncharacterized membrane protein YedE/YeeE
MTYRRGMRRLAFFMSVIYWGLVAFLIIQPFSPDVGPWDDGPPFLYQDAVVQILAVATLIYAVIFGLGWTLYGFYDDGRRRPYLED